ncbi:hypothetical protein C7974DRAFT_303875, partial [Boeremia exigua]|uniref:uncharacterized protein n=1 Tax=Boeremia exigua TaxID=749465 RepID=UPI001E8E8390
EKMWYTGFMRPWEGFKDAVLDNWLNQSYTDIFKEVQGTRWSGHFFNKKITVVRDDAELFESDFEDDVLLSALSVMDRLLITESLKRLTRTRGCLMANAEEEDIATEDCVWAPRYVFRFNNFGERRETRLIGHVEFLAGRPGALSEAYELRKTAKWGSLRCVLGDIVQWMLMNDHRYSFLVSTDEIMFLRMDIKAVKVNDRNNNLQPKTVLYEPWLHYSVPMKIADAFDYGKNTITTRMGIFHLLWLVIQDDRKWRLPAETGNCLNYATFTGDEEDLIPRRTCVPGPCVAK